MSEVIVQSRLVTYTHLQLYFWLCTAYTVNSPFSANCASPTIWAFRAFSSALHVGTGLIDFSQSIIISVRHSVKFGLCWLLIFSSSSPSSPSSNPTRCHFLLILWSILVTFSWSFVDSRLVVAIIFYPVPAVLLYAGAWGTWVPGGESTWEKPCGITCT